MNAIKFKTGNYTHINVAGTFFQGEIDESYSKLVTIFGEPIDGDGYETDAKWLIEFPDGVVATICNYKDGVSYKGVHGIQKKKLRDWHIGGKDKEVVKRVQAILDNYSEETVANTHYLDDKTVEELIDMLISDDYMVGKTEFTEPEKKYIVCSCNESLYEFAPNVFDQQPFNQLPIFYGATVREALINCLEQCEDGIALKNYDRKELVVKMIQSEIASLKADIEYSDLGVMGAIIIDLLLDLGYDHEEDSETAEYCLKATELEIWEYYMENIIPNL